MGAVVGPRVHELVASEGRDGAAQARQRGAECPDDGAGPDRIGLHELLAAVGRRVRVAVGERDVKVRVDSRDVHAHEAAAGRGGLERQLYRVGAVGQRGFVAPHHCAAGVVLDRRDGERSLAMALHEPRFHIVEDERALESRPGDPRQVVGGRVRDAQEAPREYSQREAHGGQRSPAVFGVSRRERPWSPA